MLVLCLIGTGPLRGSPVRKFWFLPAYKQTGEEGRDKREIVIYVWRIKVSSKIWLVKVASDVYLYTYIYIYLKITTFINKYGCNYVVSVLNSIAAGVEYLLAWGY